MAENEIEEVLVTAQKREQKLMDVPLSIQSFGSEQLGDASIRDVSELMTMVPGASEGISLTVGQRRFQIRGIEQGAGSPTVGYYFDDSAFYGLDFAPVGRAFDMARVEVMRGPQGTLYGGGSMGGVVRYIPNSPNLSFVEAKVSTGFNTLRGGDGGQFIDAAVSLPVIEDTLGIRLVASKENVGGYLKDALGNQNVNDADIENYRASVHWEPTDDLRVKFNYMHNVVDQNGGTLISKLDPSNPVSSSLPGDINNIEFDLSSLTLEYGFGFADLSSTTTYSTVNNDVIISLPLGFTTVTSSVVGDQKIWSNETRLTSNTDGVFQWLTGVYYTDFEQSLTSGNEWAPEIPPFFVNSFSKTVDTSKSLSIFGEFSWNLMDGELIPLVGVRYFEETLEGDSAIAAGSPDGEDFDSVNFRFNLSWFPQEGSHYFINIAEGFRSGDFNDLATCSLHQLAGLPCELILDSDELISYEVGTKQDLINGQLQLDAAIYYQDWQDARFSVPSNGLFADYAVGDAKIYGVDLGMTYSPESIEGLTMSLTGNWNSAEIVSANDLGASGAENGDRIPFVPKWTAAMSTSYKWAVSDVWAGLISMTFSHIDGQYGQFGADDARKGDVRNLLRARIGAENGKFGVYLYGNNLLNEQGEIFNQNPAGGAPLFTEDSPRLVGVEFTYQI
ncbi:TonB-dependent receptor [Porticoccaceae bacterium LTM1]|nr:TonB-dependent receptor [Porticoccaceae bacterium LTM1]